MSVCFSLYLNNLQLIRQFPVLVSFFSFINSIQFTIYKHMFQSRKLLKLSETTFRVKKHSKINQDFFPVCKDSLIVMQYESTWSKLYHIQSTGQITWQHAHIHYKKQHVKMLRNNQLLLYWEEKRMFLIVNLQDRHRIDKVKINWLENNKQCSIRNIFVFRNSDLLALQVNNIDKSTIILYYRYSQFKKGQDFLAKIITKTKNKMTKVNQHSKIGWEDSQSKSVGILKFNFIVYNIQTKKIQKETFTTINQLKKVFNIQGFLQQKIITELSCNRYLVYAEQCFGQEHKRVDIHNNDPFYANCFIIDGYKGPEQPIIKIPQQLYNLSAYKGKIIRSQMINDYIIYGFRKDDPHKIKQSIVYVNFKTSSIICEQAQRIKTLSHWVSCWQPMFITKVMPCTNMLIVNVQELTMLKDVYMSFLLEINEDFDDDLLYDAICLLSEI